MQRSNHVQDQSRPRLLNTARFNDISAVLLPGPTPHVVSRNIWNLFMLKALHPRLNQHMYWGLHQSWGIYPVVSWSSLPAFSQLGDIWTFVEVFFFFYPSSNLFKILNRVGLGTQFCSFLPESFSKLAAFQITDWVDRGIYCYICSESVLVNKYKNFGGEQMKVAC